jgi:diguanylate cyclase (GGDEF)-like protein
MKLSKLNTRYYYEETPLTEGRDSKEDNYLESEFGKPLARAKSVKEVLDIVMYQIGRIFEPRNWSILLKDPKTANLVFSVVVGENKKKLQGAKLTKGEGIAGYIMETGESLIVEDVSQDKRFSKRVDNYTGFQTRSIIGTPLKTGDKALGVIQLINRNREDAFSKKDMDLLTSIAEYAAIAIERSYYTQALTNLATKDSLTGLKNRWSFERAVSNKIEFKVQYGSIFSLLIITVDGLGRLLREQGRKTHDAGLRDLVQIINKTKRRDDTLFRYGENIFLMLLPLTYSDGSEKTKDRIEDAASLAVSQQKLPPVSVTIAHHTLSSEEIGTFTHLVDKHLAESKQPVNEERIADIEENLQPLVEKEGKKAADEGGDKKGFGKAVSLGGHFIHPQSRLSVSIRIKELSLNAIAFTIQKPDMLGINDFLDVQFVLDDLKRSVIKRQIIIRKIEGENVQADFYNPPPYAKHLGFYLIH